jgi:hypothetical protein
VSCICGSSEFDVRMSGVHMFYGVHMVMPSDGVVFPY